ncbi:hypothetical protein QJS04_geneDACA024814 [Acorus gramineus]|uniref:HMA domain-containing protein n=1 Tax=Acorus gramineus TaxID=55184 RepID=A0AAV8ZZP3_ACOGR|nr:hypothetical protein QJS04_geneDACA024814 [Acorus gramineus]
MSKEEDINFLKIQTCVLKVNIHCDGCKQKVKKILHKIDGVYKTTIDAEQGKVTVSGNVDPAILIKKLVKSGKHAELWGSPKGGGGGGGGNHNQINNQIQKLQLDINGKGSQKDNGKPQNGNNKGGGGVGKDPKVQKPQQPQLPKEFQLKDLKFPFQTPQKTVKFNLPEEDYGSDFDDDDYFDDEDGFDDDDLSDDDDDDDFDGDVKDNKMLKPLMNGHGKPPLSDKKAANANGNNNGGGGGGGDAQNKEKGGKSDGKNGGNGKKGGDGGNIGGNQNQGGGGGGGKSGGKNGGGPQDAKNGGNSKPALNSNGGGGGNNGGGGKSVNAMMFVGGGNGPMGHQGLPATMNPGYFQGAIGAPEMMPVAANPYQQYLASMMMNQQRQMGNNEQFQQMMYARPPPTVYNMPPPPYAHFFSDENPNSCSIM